MKFLSFNNIMFSYIYKKLIKNIADVSLKSPHSRFLNQRYFSETAKNNSLVCLFKNYGFTDLQISTLLSKQPFLLSMNEDKVIKPRLDLFTSYGFSSADIYDILVFDKELLRRSIKNQIIPSCEYLKSVLKDNQLLVATVKRSTWVLKQNFRDNLEPNIEILRNYGVLESRISAFLRLQPRLLLTSKDRFEMVIKEVIEMGFDPLKRHFIGAYQVKSGLKKTMWDRKWNYYKKWGWTDDEILSAFKKQPGILAASEEKIERVLDFLIKKMGWNASEVSTCPLVIMHSLEKWTMPRCFVVQFLLSKDALKEDITLNRFIIPMENRFKEKYVDKYRLQYPEILDLYARVNDNTQNSP